MGTHLRVLSENYPIDTNMAGFGVDGFQKCLRYSALDVSSLSIGMLNRVANTHLRVLSDSYVMNTNMMVFKSICVLGLWTKVASALGGLRGFDMVKDRNMRH